MKGELPARRKLRSDSGAAPEGIGKPLEENDNEAISGMIPEDFFGKSGVPCEPTPQDIKKALGVVLSRSVTKGSFTAALKSIDLMGRPFGVVMAGGIATNVALVKAAAMPISRPKSGGNDGGR